MGLGSGLGHVDLSYIIEHAQDRIIIVDANLLHLLEQVVQGTRLRWLRQVERRVLDAVELFICVGEDGIPKRWKCGLAPWKGLLG